MRCLEAVLLAAGVLGACLALGGCRGCEAGRPGLGAASALPSASAAPSAARKPKRPPPPPVLKPLRAPEDIVALDVPGYLEAAVSVPRGATQPRPIVIALHGENDRPEWQCRAWRDISRGYPWVLCPRGALRADSPASDRRFTYASLQEATRELRAALGALKDRYVYHVAPGPVVLVGFSLGAQYAARIAKQEPSFFSRVVLVEGGADQWASGVATLFQRGGGTRVLFVCGRPECTTAAEERRAMSERLGLDGRVASVPGGGHVYDGTVAQALEKEYSWLVAGDSRFAAEGPSPLSK